MAFVNSGGTASGGFKTETKRYVVGYGLVVDFEKDLPRKFVGDAIKKGYQLSGHVVAVLGAKDDGSVPALGSMVSVLLRPRDNAKDIFDDLEKTRESMRFFLEGVSGKPDALEARWAHGAGANRSVQALEIVGAPHLSFENPVPNSGPKNGFLYLNLDGTPTSFDVRGNDGVYLTHQLPFADVVGRLKTTLEKNGKFRVSQRVLSPSLSVLVDDQSALDSTLAAFRAIGFTNCVVRSFIPGTNDPKQVDVQLLSWPQDVPSTFDYAGTTYEAPVLRETARFIALRDGKATACMEVIPGYVMNLIGNKDVEKSTKHKFAHGVVKGLSDSQKGMYAAQSYGPGVAVFAVHEDGAISGLSRLAIRTEGIQYDNLMSIPTPNFVDADKIQMALVSTMASDDAS